MPMKCPLHDAEYVLAFTECFNEAWKSRFPCTFDRYYTGGIKEFLRKRGRTPGQPGRTIHVSDDEVAESIDAEVEFAKR